MIKDYYLRKYLQHLVSINISAQDNCIRMHSCTICQKNIMKDTCNKHNGRSEILFPDTETVHMYSYHRTCLEYIGKAVGERLEQDLYNEKLTIRKK